MENLDILLEFIISESVKNKDLKTNDPQDFIRKKSPSGGKNPKSNKNMKTVYVPVEIEGDPIKLNKDLTSSLKK